MKNSFLKELYRKLNPLNKQERLKCTNEYDEVILDRMEQGENEEQIVHLLGDSSKIAEELLTEYYENFNHSKVKMLYVINKNYMILDICTVIFTYFLSYLIYFVSNRMIWNVWIMPFKLYVSYLPGIVIVMIVSNFLCSLYTPIIIQKSKANFHVIQANIITGVLILFFLYLFNTFDFSRMILLIFLGMNIGSGILVRNYLAEYFI